MLEKRRRLMDDWAGYCNTPSRGAATRGTCSPSARGAAAADVAVLLLQLQHARQPKRDRWDVGDERKRCQHDAVERPDPSHDLLHGDFADCAAHEKDRADRRMAKPD